MTTTLRTHAKAATPLDYAIAILALSIWCGAVTFALACLAGWLFDPVMEEWRGWAILAVVLVGGPLMAIGSAVAGVALLLRWHERRQMGREAQGPC
jgi:hypothetical protein